MTGTQQLHTAASSRSADLTDVYASMRPADEETRRLRDDGDQLDREERAPRCDASAAYRPNSGHHRVEYRQLRLEQVVLASHGPRGTRRDAELNALVGT